MTGHNVGSMKLLPRMVFLWMALFPVMLCAQAPSTLEAPTRMSPKQYAAFLDELDSKLPLLKAHFEMLCANPVWRNERSELRSVSNQALDACRAFSKEVIPFLGESIVEERVKAKLSVEFKMQSVMKDLISMANQDSSLRPYYDSRSEDAEFILKTLTPLFLSLLQPRLRFDLGRPSMRSEPGALEVEHSTEAPGLARPRRRTLEMRGGDDGISCSFDTQGRTKPSFFEHSASARPAASPLVASSPPRGPSH